MNKYEKDLKEFLEKYPNKWHSYTTDKLTLKTIEGLHIQDGRMVLSRSTCQMKLIKKG
jgi:hypothetical protein